MEEEEKLSVYSNTLMTPTMFEHLTTLTYVNMFGSNKSAYIRSLITKEWEKYEQSRLGNGIITERK